MLEFFRQYQKYFFIVIAAVIITSFLFFGTFSTFSSREERKDPVVARGVSGSPLMLSEIQALSRFIAADREDALGYGAIPNLCNDGVIRYDLLRTGLADLLADSYFAAIKQDLEARLDRAKRFRPYVHSEVPGLSAEAVWKQFSPGILSELEGLKQETEASASTFTRFSRLYQQQSRLTPEMLRNILCFQHRYFGLGLDQGLQQGDLSLFAFHSLSDWFGRNFLTIASEFILNAAAAAIEKGYAVTLEEAKGDLLANFQASLQKLHADPSIPAPTFSQHLRSLGFDETRAAEVWRNVLLFRRYFQGASEAAFVDRLPFKEFASFARETATLAVYQWPEALRLKTIEDLIEFQFYLSAVAPELENPLDLPVDFYSPETVEKDFPELVQASYKAKVKEISLPQIALRAPLKEVWDWQLEEKNWDALKAAFSFLSQGCSREERFGCLEKLSSPQRLQIDAYARLRILERHPEWLEEAVSAAASQERVLSISKASSSLLHIEKPWRLSGFLEKAAASEAAAQEELLAYSDNETTLYRFEEIEKLSPPRILTFGEAKSQGLLARISDRSLSAAYPKIRAKSPEAFRSKEGSWKPFSEVKTEVAKRVYPDVFRAIEGLEKRVWTDSLYAQYRLFAKTLEAHTALRNDPADFRWTKDVGSAAIYTNENRDFGKEASQTDSSSCLCITNQFKLERNELPIQRTSHEEWMKENAFVMMPNEWSPIRVPPNGELSFFYLIDKKPCESPVLDQISFGKELIARDAKLYMAEKLLASIFQNHSIVLPTENDE